MVKATYYLTGKPQDENLNWYSGFINGMLAQNKWEEDKIKPALVICSDDETWNIALMKQPLFILSYNRNNALLNSVIPAYNPIAKVPVSDVDMEPYFVRLLARVDSKANKELMNQIIAFDIPNSKYPGTVLKNSNAHTNYECGKSFSQLINDYLLTEEVGN